jgi:hypothetical protein
MGLQELFKKIENDFKQETLLEFNIILNDASNNLSPEERGIFLDWLEYEFLHNQLSLYDTQQVSLASVKEQLSTEAIEEIKKAVKKQKRYTEYIQKWIFENKSENFTARISEKETNNPPLKENYLGQPANETAIKFFEFLSEYYRPDDVTKVKYVNILHFLKYDADRKYFIFRLKQEEYKKMVEKRLGILLTKFEKSETYQETEKPIFYSLENTFLKNMR